MSRDSSLETLNNLTNNLTLKNESKDNSRQFDINFSN